MGHQLFIALLLVVVMTTDWASAGKKKKLLKEISSKISTLQGHVDDIKDKLDILDDMDSKLSTIEDRLDDLPSVIGAMSRTEMDMILEKIDEKCNCLPSGAFDKFIRDDDGYFLAFRLTAGIGKSAYDKYTDVGNNDDESDLVFHSVPCGCKTTNGSLYCDRHYRSMLLDLWPRIPVEKVKVMVCGHGMTKKTIIFDGEGSTYLNFFEQSRILEDPYTDLSASDPSPNFFSIAGHDISATAKRRFFINNNYGGCPADAGWLVVGDGPDGPCAWEQPHDFPYVLYGNDPSPSPTATEHYVRSVWESGVVGHADILTVSIKLKDKDEC